MVKFTPELETLVSETIANANGQKAREIAQTLNDRGVKTPSGGNWKGYHVSNFKLKQQKKRLKKKVQPKINVTIQTKVNKSVSTALLQDLLAASTLTDQQKLKMISVYVNG